MIKKSGKIFVLSLFRDSFFNATRLFAESKKVEFFPIIEISADSYFELGFQLGEKNRARICEFFKRAKRSIELRRKFIFEDRAKRYEPFISALEFNFPDYLDELKGMAEGAKIDFDSLFVLNLNPELSAMLIGKRENEDCSTVIVKTRDKIIFAHNEDGAKANLGLMSLVFVRAPSGVKFIVLSYPGIVMGNGPGINSAGIIHSCNFIGNKKYKEGIPRYFIDRAILEAKALKDAIHYASHPERAYSQCHNLVSIPEMRALSIESAIDKISINEIQGTYLRTNHYIFPEMKDEKEYPRMFSSSLARLNSLEKDLGKIEPQNIGTEDVIYALSSHRGKQKSVCRHPKNFNTAQTLGTMLFDSEEMLIRYYYANPCKENFQDLTFP